MNEDELVGALREIFAPVRGTARVLLGIGDDAAVWQPSRSHRSIITTDALIEGVHFDRSRMSLREIGARAMTANLSDVAAMGARPRLATVALGVPGDSGDDVLELCRGMAERCAPFRVTVAGGDLTRAPVLTISITVVGEVRPSNLKTRAGGKAGDVLAVTGPLGSTRAGLLSADTLAVKQPEPRVNEGIWLGASTHVHAMIDLSDGLSTDAARLAAASDVAAVLDEVPVAADADAVARARGEGARDFALAGGEDFELLAAVDRRAFAYLARRFEQHFGRPLLRTGTLRAGSGVFLRDEHAERPLVPTGWDHFAKPEARA